MPFPRPPTEMTLAQRVGEEMRTVNSGVIHQMTQKNTHCVLVAH